MDKKIPLFSAVIFLGSSTIACALPELSPILKSLPIPIRIVAQTTNYIIPPPYKKIHCTVFLGKAPYGIITTIKNNKPTSMYSATVDRICNQNKGERAATCTLTQRYVDCTHHLKADPVLSQFKLINREYYLRVPQSVTVNFH